MSVELTFVLNAFFCYHADGRNPDTKITILADDSYIIDKEAEKEEWRKDLAAGLRSKSEYRKHFYGETDEEAAAAVAAIKAENPSISDLLGE